MVGIEPTTFCPSDRRPQKCKLGRRSQLCPRDANSWKPDYKNLNPKVHAWNSMYLENVMQRDLHVHFKPGNLLTCAVSKSTIMGHYADFAER